jgi:DNA polymerase alpha subunit B
LNVNLPEKAVLKDGDIGFTSLTPVKIGGSDFKCNVDKKYRYMFTTLPERARALDQRLTKMAGEMEERYGMENVSAVGVPCTEEVQVVGRICNEAHEGRINKTSVVLEGDRGNAGGARIELGLEALKTYSVFPGQIVGVQGLNPSGRKMVAKKICEGVPKPMAKSKAGELMKLQYDDRNGQPLSVFAASGPFTTSGDLDYAPLVDLLAIASRLQPDAVILTGPFVDVNHPLCKDGEVNFEDVDGNKVPVTYETVFQDRVARTIEEFFDDGQACPTQFILVPSLEDAFHDNVYPQPPFADRIQGGVVMDIPGGEGIKVGTLGIEDVEEVVKQKQTQVREWERELEELTSESTSLMHPS